MKMFIALSAVARNVHNEEKYPHILISQLYRNLTKIVEYRPRSLMLDSGAFTAWNSGSRVTVQEVIAAYHEMEQAMGMKALCINLDVIPGEVGRNSTPGERTAAMERSLRNADRLRAAGFTVTEVYHQDEPQAFLERLLARLPGDGVLCVSPRNDTGVNVRKKWLQSLFAFFRTRDIQPRIHILGLTTLGNTVYQYPIYSADSATYTLSARFGSILNDRGKIVKVGNMGIRNSHLRESSNQGIRRMLRSMQQVERSATRYWRRKGIVWEP